MRAIRPQIVEATQPKWVILLPLEPRQEIKEMQTFAQYIDRWHDFYMLAGTAAATLIGLLFVSLTLSIEVMSDESQIGLKELATQTFALVPLRPINFALVIDS